MSSTSHRSGKDAHHPHEPGGLVGFFAHHGVWAPGIRLFRNLNFRSKAWLISAMFLLPMSVLGAIYLRQAAAITSFAEQEQVGIGYAKDVLQLLSQLRTMRHGAMQGTEAAGAGAPTDAQAIREQLHRLEALEKQTLGNAGDTRGTDALEVLRANIDKALNQPAKSPLAAYKRYTMAIDAAFTLLESVVDRSGLALDPDLDTKYLIQVSLMQLPRVTGSALAQGELAMAAARGANRAMSFAAMAPHRAIDDYLDSQIRQSLDNVSAIWPQFGQRISYAGTQEALNTLQALSVVVGEEDGKIDQPAIVAATQAMADRAGLLQKQLLGELEPLLQARVDRVHRESLMLGSLLAVSLLLVFYMFRSFSNVIQGGLWEVRRHLTAMTDGDLTTIPQPWGKDEAAKLMLTLRKMQDALRDIVTQVRHASEGIVDDSRKISGSALELSSCTEQNAASLQSSSMAINQIGNVVRETADRAAEATAIGRDNVNAAERGGQVIGQVITTMHDIHAASSKISEIISVIDGIAFQTNILALNAAVEAARAGDTGRGFAVVASEVRSLARRSATAAHEIKALINSSVEKVSAGTGVVEQAGAVIGEIVTSSHRANLLLEGMASSIRDQAKSVTDVGQSVVQVNSATQHNAVLVEQTAQAASALQEQANVLAQRVARFQLPG